MKIAIHQPNFIPWLGYFSKIKYADQFILLDIAEYSKNSFINRNKIIVQGHERWLTIPINYKGSSKKEIREISISPNFRPDKISKTLTQEYRPSEPKKEILSEFDEMLQKGLSHQSLCLLNQMVIGWICDRLQIQTKISTASELNIIGGNATQTIIDICKTLGGDTYVSGKSGKKYLKEELFEKEGIGLEYLGNQTIMNRFGPLSTLHHLLTEEHLSMLL